MTSKIKVDNINKVSDDSNIINKCGTTITLGASGDSIALASGATQTGFGRTGTVDWDTTPKTATFTAVSGDGFFANTSGSAFTMNLPAGSAGAIVSVADYAGTWQTNALTVSPNGTDKIGSVNADVVLNTEGQSVTFIFVDSTQGWINTMDSTSNERGNEFITATGGTITTCGNDKIHTFTGPGTFTVSAAAVCSANNVVSHVVVAGGGGGGGHPGNDGGGGAGAGGYREVKSPVTPYTASPLDGYPSSPNRVTVTATAFPITVGAGGSPGNQGSMSGTTGSNSIFSSITSAGGGNGRSGSCTPVTAGPGGSGGGGGGGFGTGGSGFGNGNTPPVSPAQGNPGGTGSSSGPPDQRSGGGGGAAAAGGASAGPSPTASGVGGNGVSSSITGSSVARAGGGAGAGGACGTCRPGGTGGGGNGNSGGTGQAGTTNTGGGGGGGANGAGGAGGSGIVIIRYKFQ
jgi:hypothetical protein